MSLTLPTTPKFQTLNIKSNTMTFNSRSVSGRVQRKTSDTQYWSFTASYPIGKRSDYGALMAFIVKCRGGFNSFTARLPAYSTTQGSLVQATNTLLVDNSGGYAIGTTQLAVDVSPGINITGALKAGDFITFANHNKVYMVVEDLDIDGSGDGTLTIEPPLIASVANDETITYGDVQFTCKLNGDVQEFSAGLGDTIKYEIDIVEDI